MKMIDKKYIYILVIVAVLVAAISLYKRSEPDSLIGSSPSPTISSSSTPVPTPTVTPKPKPKGTPGLNIKEESSYYYLATSLDKENRYFAVAADCSSINPSAVAFKNNTEVMIDNAASDKAHILKIGDKSYYLDPHAWILTTLSSSVLPVYLSIFCESIELGQIELN